MESDSSSLPLLCPPLPIYSADDAVIVEPLSNVFASAVSSNLYESTSTDTSRSPQTGSQFYCKLCKKKYSTESTFQAHLSSAKHQKEAQGRATPLKKPQEISSNPSISRPTNTNDEELNKAILTQQQALVLAKSDLERAYKVMLQAAKDFSKLFRLRQAAECYKFVIYTQQKLWSKSLAEQHSPSFYSLTVPVPPTPEFIKTVGYVMVMFKSQLYSARIWRAFSRDTALRHFLNCIWHVFPQTLWDNLLGEYERIPYRDLEQKCMDLADQLQPILAFVDNQRASGRAGSIPEKFSVEVAKIFSEFAVYECDERASKLGVTLLLLARCIDKLVDINRIHWQAILHAQLGERGIASDLWLECFTLSGDASYLYRAVQCALEIGDLVRAESLLTRIPPESDFDLLRRIIKIATEWCLDDLEELIYDLDIQGMQQLILGSVDFKPVLFVLRERLLPRR